MRWGRSTSAPPEPSGWGPGRSQVQILSPRLPRAPLAAGVELPCDLDDRCAVVEVDGDDRALGPALDRRGRDVVLDDQDEDPCGMPLQEAPDDPELLAERLRSELAQRVAQIGLARAVRQPPPDATRNLIGGPKRGLRELLADLV